MTTSTLSCLVSSRLPSSFSHTNGSLLVYSSSDIPGDIAVMVFGAFTSASLNRPIRGKTDQDRRIRGAAARTQPPTPQAAERVPLVRIHSSCFTGEVFGSTRCDCAEQLHSSMRSCSAAAHGGIIIYLPQEGRGIGLAAKLRAYNLIDMGHDTVSANVALGLPVDARRYDAAVAILSDLGVARIRLLTNNPDKVGELSRAGIQIVERIPMVPVAWTGHDDFPAHRMPSPQTHLDWNSHKQEEQIDGRPNQRPLLDRDSYLVTKVVRMGHILDVPSSIMSSMSPQQTGNGSVHHENQNGTDRI